MLFYGNRTLSSRYTCKKVEARSREATRIAVAVSSVAFVAIEPESQSAGSHHFDHSQFLLRCSALISVSKDTASVNQVLAKPFKEAYK
jgi:hypothetical protein